RAPRRATRSRRGMSLLRRDDRAGDGRGAGDHGAHRAARLGESPRSSLSGARRRCIAPASSGDTAYRAEMKLGSVSRERWRVLEPLLDAALEVEPARRPSFIAAACGRDLRLRGELESLIEACEHADAILTEPAVITYHQLLDRETTAELPQSLGGRY